MSSVRGIFPNRHLARRGIAALLDQGVKPGCIWALIPVERGRTGKIEMENLVASANQGLSFTTKQDARHGSVLGGGLGACAALAGIAFSLFVPGAGWVTGGAAVWTAAWSGLGTLLGGMLAGGAAGALCDGGAGAAASAPGPTSQRERTVIVDVDCADSQQAAALAVRTLSKYQARTL